MKHKQKRSKAVRVLQILDNDEYYDSSTTTTHSTSTFSSSNSNNNNPKQLTHNNNSLTSLTDTINSASSFNNNTTSSSSSSNNNTTSSSFNNNTTSSSNNSNKITSSSNNSNTTTSSSSNTGSTSTLLLPTNISGRKSTSKVWLYAIKSDDGKMASCLLCDYTCTIVDHSTSTIRYHLIHEHDKYDLIIKRPSTSSSEPHISERFRRDLHALCYRSIIIDQRPFNDFQKDGIMAIFNKLCPGYVPPHRNQVSSKLKDLYKYYADQLKDELKEVDYIGLTLDFWTNRRSISFLCITGHWFKDSPFEFVSKIIHFSSFDERHTATNIARSLKEKLINLEIYHKVIAITCDGAQNLVAALNQLDDSIKRIWCCAHRLHLVVINGLGFWKKTDDHDDTTSSSTNLPTTIITSPDVISKNQENAMDISWCDEDEPDDLSNHEHGGDVNNGNIVTMDSVELNNKSKDESITLNNHQEDIDDLEKIDLIDDNWSTTIDTNIDLTEEIQLIVNLLKKCRSIANVLKKSTVLSAFIRAYTLLIQVNKAINIDCKSRWNSTYLLLESLIDSKEIIIKLFNEKRTLNLRKDQLDKLCMIELKSHDWEFLTSLKYVLKPFFEATKMMSGKNYPSIGLAYHGIQKIYNFCLNNKNNNDQIKLLKKLLLFKLNQYFYDDPEQYEYFQQHAFFDPASHLSLTDMEKQQCERYVQNLIVNDIYPQKEISTDVPRSSSTAVASSTSAAVIQSFSSSNISKNVSAYDAFIEACEDPEVQFKTSKAKSKRIMINDGFKLYKIAIQEFNSNNQPSTTSVLNFWKKYHMQLPLLFKLAKIHLVVCSTSVSSESTFSSSAYTARKERARLSPENLCYTVFLKDKLDKS
ncbi:unnamed protein product [Rotaria sp. Silwood2]|nr:unnamed protein product [Rotaria sp. Silwood2]CAF4374175.1 unnamed protein product [Rotaria sp. Silwood2]